MKKTKLALWAAYLVLFANPLAVFGASDEAAFSHDGARQEEARNTRRSSARLPREKIGAGQ